MMDLFWDPIGAWQHGLIDGGTRFVDKKNQSLTFGTLFCGLEFLGEAWESGIHVFSIYQMDQRKISHPRDQSI
jgi:hypothetical protein